MKSIFICCTLFLVSTGLKAQFVKDSADQLVLITKSSPDSITLRWAPGSYRLWRAGIAKGYQLERREYGKGEFKIVAGGILRPYTLEEFKARTNIDNDYIALSAEMMHGEIMKTAADAKQFSDYLLAHEEQENRFGLALLAADLYPPAADAQALRYVDRDVEPGKRYEYRLTIPGLPEDWTIEPVKRMAGAAELQFRAKVLDVVTENTEHGVLVKWDRLFNDAFFTAYHIERAPEHSAVFTRLNSRPLMFSKEENGPTFNFYLDSLPENQRTYQYRIIGVDAFGDLSIPSDTVSGMGIDLTGPMPPSAVKAYENAEGHMTIEWLNQSMAPDHDGFYIGRSTYPTGPFTHINMKPLPVSTTRFTDKDAVRYQAHYYVVIAVDKAGNTNKSHMAMGLWRDSTPPSQPVGLNGHVDTLGYVTLIWTPGTEPDLLGYRVYVANAPDVEFFQVTDDIQTSNFFVDSVSLMTLSEKVYYKIVAVDRNYNPSPYSEVIALDRPDKIPPSSPVFSSYRVMDGHVIVQWHASSAKDVIRQNLYRKTAEDDWTLLKTLSPSDTIYADTTAQALRHYVYRIEAIDDRGLASKESKPLQVFVTNHKTVSPIEGVTARYEADRKGVSLTWPERTNVVKYNIYRAAGEKDMQYYDSTKEALYVDTQLYKSAGTFAYAVQAVYPDGNKSPLSSPVRLSFDKSARK